MCIKLHSKIMWQYCKEGFEFYDASWALSVVWDMVPSDEHWFHFVPIDHVHKHRENEKC